MGFRAPWLRSDASRWARDKKPYEHSDDVDDADTHVVGPVNLLPCGSWELLAEVSMPILRATAREAIDNVQGEHETVRGSAFGQSEGCSHFDG
jgi:hypothetical protein